MSRDQALGISTSELLRATVYLWTEFYDHFPDPDEIIYAYFKHLAEKHRDGDYPLFWIKGIFDDQGPQAR